MSAAFILLNMKGIFSILAALFLSICFGQSKLHVLVFENSEPVVYGNISYSDFSLKRSGYTSDAGLFQLPLNFDCTDSIEISCLSCVTLKLSLCETPDTVVIERSIEELEEVRVYSNSNSKKWHHIKSKNFGFNVSYAFGTGGEFTIPLSPFIKSSKPIRYFKAVEFPIKSNSNFQQSYLVRFKIYKLNNGKPTYSIYDEVLQVNSNVKSLKFEPETAILEGQKIAIGLEILDCDDGQPDSVFRACPLFIKGYGVSQETQKVTFERNRLLIGSSWKIVPHFEEYFIPDFKITYSD